MVWVNIIKYLNAVREQFQSCWLFMFSAFSHTKPQNHSGAQEEHLGQAADAKLQEQFPKTSGRQTDRQTPRGAGLGCQPEQPGRNPFLENHLVGAASAHTKAAANCKSQLTLGDRFGRRQQPVALSGAAATPDQACPFEEQPPWLVSNLLMWLLLQTVSTGSASGLGEKLECLWKPAGTRHFFVFFRHSRFLAVSEKSPALQVICLKQPGKTRLTILWFQKPFLVSNVYSFS